MGNPENDIEKKAEKFMTFLKEEWGDVHENDILSEFKVNPRDFEKVKTLLFQEGYLYFYGDKFAKYALTASGRRFNSFADEREKEDQKAKTEKEINNLTIENNKNQPLNYKSQQKIARTALLISLFSALISLFSVASSFFSSKNRNQITPADWNKLITTQEQIEQAIRQKNDSLPNQAFHKTQ